MNTLNDDDIDQLIEQNQAKAELRSVISTQGLAEQILNSRDAPSYRLPWPHLDGRYQLRGGEVTVWAGENGSGKSLLVGQVMAWLLAAGQRVLIASMEMKPTETVLRMCRQTAGCQPAPAYVTNWCDWADGKLWLYDQLDTVPSDRILLMVRAVAEHLGIQHVVIDSLVKCGVPQDGNGALTAQTMFVDRLQHAAKALGIHVHLVAHLRKPERDSGGRPSKYDIRGASQISDLADNVILLARNRVKERVLNNLTNLPGGQGLEEDAILEQPDAFLTVAKQRHFPWEGTVGLDYLRESDQFIRPGTGKALPWPDHTMQLPWTR